MPTGQAHLDYTLAGLNVLGGGIAYAKKKSLPSLLGGCAIGAAYLGTAYMIENVDGFQGHIAGATTSVLLAGLMGSRYAKTGKMMPAGGLAAVGALATVYHGVKAQSWA